MNMETFYCVWRHGGSPPTVMHPTLIRAEQEAERLAQSMPGETFVVLVSLKAVEVNNVRWQSFPDLPF